MRPIGIDGGGPSGCIGRPIDGGDGEVVEGWGG